MLLRTEGEGVDLCRVVGLTLLGNGEGMGVGWLGGAETRWCDPACVTSARGVGKDGKLGAVEGVAGRAAVRGREGHEAAVANFDAERVACALEACGQVGFLYPQWQVSHQFLKWIPQPGRKQINLGGLLGS